MSSPPKASDGLNPSMTHRLPPPAGNTTYLRIDSPTQDPKYRARVRLSRIIRFCLAWLAFGPLLGLSIVGGMFSHQFTVIIWYELLFVIVWQLFHLLPQLSTLARGVSRRLLPRISLSIGDASCVVGGGEEDDDELLRVGRGDYYSQQQPPPKKNLASLFTTAVDFSFGLTLIVFGALWNQARCCSFWQHLPSIILAIILGCLMVIAAFFSLYKTYHTMAFEFVLYKDGTVQPISLGRTEVDVSSRRGEPVSISA
ncbi:hypothetical protein V8F33_012091 [Rhypophila sp. PSN 637]